MQLWRCGGENGTEWVKEWVTECAEHTGSEAHHRLPHCSTQLAAAYGAQLSPWGARASERAAHLGGGGHGGLALCQRAQELSDGDGCSRLMDAATCVMHIKQRTHQGGSAATAGHPAPQSGSPLNPSTLAMRGGSSTPRLTSLQMYTCFAC